MVRTLAGAIIIIGALIAFNIAHTTDAKVFSGIFLIAGLSVLVISLFKDYP